MHRHPHRGVAPHDFRPRVVKLYPVDRGDAATCVLCGQPIAPGDATELHAPHRAGDRRRVHIACFRRLLRTTIAALGAAAHRFDTDEDDDA